MQTLVNLLLETGGPAAAAVLLCYSVQIFAAELLQDDVEFPNAILQDGYR